MCVCIYAYIYIYSILLELYLLKLFNNDFDYAVSIIKAKVDQKERKCSPCLYNPLMLEEIWKIILIALYSMVNALDVDVYSALK